MGYDCCGGDDGVHLDAESNQRGIWGAEKGKTNKHRKQVGVVSTKSYIFGRFKLFLSIQKNNVK